jgi:DNA (cytosine-5)-methyltransferase 1
MLRDEELIVDNFAGGGGASTGIETALSVLAPGRHVDVAINHDPEALALHAANHPKTRHYCQSVWKADPRDVVAGPDGRPRPVGLAWFSPDCKHFSKAKGGKPVEKKIRDLAWVVVHWAKLVKPRIIMLENVEEFRDWGPLIETADGKLIPCPLRKGFTFKRWIRELKKLGYVVEHRELRACDYGTPTIRKRLFLIARCDGAPIVWPKATHKPVTVSADGIVTKWAKGQGLTLKDIQYLKPWRTAAECIDWSLALVIGHMAQHNTGLVGHAPDKPLSTLTQGGSQQQVVTSHLIKLRGTCAHGQATDEPAPTITAGGLHLGEVRCFMVKYYGEGGQDQAITAPMHTQTTKPRMALVSTHLIEAETTLSDELRYAAWWCARFIENYEPRQARSFPAIPGPRAGAVGHGDFVLVDIGQRMLTPRERYRAQGFPDSYIIDPLYEGKPLTETAQGRMCGNSVCPPMANALVLANFAAPVAAESEVA